MGAYVEICTKQQLEVKLARMDFTHELNDVVGVVFEECITPGFATVCFRDCIRNFRICILVYHVCILSSQTLYYASCTL